MVICLALCKSGKRKCFLYQPIPVGRYPPEAPAGSFSPKGPSMLQSWGRATFFQFASENSKCCASGMSPLQNFQPKSKLSRTLGATPSKGVSAKPDRVEPIAETSAAILTCLIRSRRLTATADEMCLFIFRPLNAACTYQMWSSLEGRCQLRRRILENPAGRSRPAPTKIRLCRGHLGFLVRHGSLLRETAFVLRAFLETVRPASCTRPASSCRRPPRR